MASKPIERHIKRQIAERGGWERILERLASGETVTDIARTFTRPDGQAISRSFLSNLLHKDPERSQLAYKAKVEGASAMVDHALRIVDSAPIDRDSIAKAKVMADMRVRVAGFLDREQFGERRDGMTVNVNMASLHLDALRHRELPTVAVPLAGSLADGMPSDGSLSPLEHSEPHVRETDTRQTDTATQPEACLLYTSDAADE